MTIEWEVYVADALPRGTFDNFRRRHCRAPELEKFTPGCCFGRHGNLPLSLSLSLFLSLTPPLFFMFLALVYADSIWLEISLEGGGVSFCSVDQNFPGARHLVPYTIHITSGRPETTSRHLNRQQTTNSRYFYI